MAESVVRYKSTDGSEWRSEADADERNALIVAVGRAMSPLKPIPDFPDCRFQNGHGFVQQGTAAVRKAKAALIELTRPRLRGWCDRQEKEFGKNLLDVHPSNFGYFLAGSPRPLYDAWGRLCCIDDQGREWGQPYYATHPSEAGFQEAIA